MTVRPLNLNALCVISSLFAALALVAAQPTSTETANLRKTGGLQITLPTGYDSRFDWPCYRGPQRNGISPETGWNWQWSSNGPAVRWHASVGKGFSSFTLVSNRVVTLGNTNETDTVFCFAADTGALLWKHSYPCEAQPLSYEGGPGATPATDGQRVFTFSKGGDLFCLDAADGRVIWSKKFEPWPHEKGDWANTWRYSGSPLVMGDKLFLSLGQAGAAFNKHDGSVIWQSPAGHPGYSSPVPYGGQSGDALAFFSGRAIIGTERETGKRLWTIPWKTLWDLNAADPIIDGNRLFVSSGNGVGCALYDLTTEPPREVWRNRNLKTLMNSAVLWKGHLYGFNDTHLSCISWETGEELWSTRELRKGSLIIAGGKLILLSENGKLVVAEPNEKQYEPLAEARILEGRCWTTPVLSNGLLFARNAAGDVVCLDLRKPQPGQR